MVIRRPRLGCLAQLIGCVAVLASLALIVVTAWALTAGADAVLVAPWGYSLFGRPSLAGHWVGTFTTPSGIRFALYLELERAKDEGGAPVSDDALGELIEGRGSWCDDHGRRLENTELHGSVPPYSGMDGSIDRLTLQLEAGKTPPLGLLPTQLDGQWQGDSLILQPGFSFWTGAAFQASTSNQDQTRPLTITLHIGEAAEFRAACARWGTS